MFYQLIERSEVVIVKKDDWNKQCDYRVELEEISPYCTLRVYSQNVTKVRSPLFENVINYAEYWFTSLIVDRVSLVIADSILG